MSSLRQGCDHLSAIFYIESVNHPIYKLMRSTVSLFNEEPGELVLSVLSQTTLPSTNKADLETIDAHLRLTHASTARSE